jgi:acetyl-CoA acetyltransferase
MPSKLESLAVRLVSEGLITADQAARLIPSARRRRGHVTESAVVKLIASGRLDGLRAQDWCTSRAAVARFLALRTKRALAAIRGSRPERLTRESAPNLPRARPIGRVCSRDRMPKCARIRNYPQPHNTKGR